MISILSSFIRLAMLCNLLWQTAAAHENPAPEPRPATVALSFLDSRLFDGRMAQELAREPKVLEVQLLSRVSLSSIPARLDRWVAIVGEHGQLRLQAVEGPPTRSLFGLVGAVFDAVKEFREQRVLELAKPYNATLFYRRDANGDALIERIVFERKPAS